MKWPAAGQFRLSLPPTHLDLIIARWIARRATPRLERSIKPFTYLADEKIVLAAGLSFWMFCRASRRGSPAREWSNQIAFTVVLSATLPHLIKHFVNRERPDRKVVHGSRHGIPRSGNKWDSFPSGHAVQLGAMAAICSRMMGPRVGWCAWPTALLLATTRVLLLAHYVSDVLIGLALGRAVTGTVSTLTRRGSAQPRRIFVGRNSGAGAVSTLPASPRETRAIDVPRQLQPSDPERAI